MPHLNAMYVKNRLFTKSSSSKSTPKCGDQITDANIKLGKTSVLYKYKTVLKEKCLVILLIKPNVCNNFDFIDLI